MNSIKAGLKKILPLAEPKVTSWAWRADLFSILCNNEETDAWRLSNYILLICMVSTRTGFYMFDYTPTQDGYMQCPWLDLQIFSRAYLDRHYNYIIDFFIESLEEENYIFAVFDEGVFLNSNGHEKRPHQLLIFGYDRIKEIFYANDFTFKGYYSTAEISFADAAQAYYNISYDDDMMRMNIGKGIALLHFKEKCSYQFDKNLVRSQLIKYIGDKDIFMPTHILGESSFYGMSVYDVLYDILGRMKVESYPLDIRPFHVLYDHKLLMCERINYMLSHQIISLSLSIVEDLKCIAEKALILRNVFLKIKISKQAEQSMFIRLIDGYKWIQEKEHEIITQILSALI